MLPTDATRNRLLKALSPEAWSRLNLIPVDLPRGQVLHPAGAAIDSVYFPEDGMISMVANLEDGTQAEVGIVGFEGMVGISLVAGIDTSFVEAMVQLPGHGWRIDARAFRHEFESNTGLRAMLLRYNEALQAQVMQTAACNGRHDMKRRLSRWLLMCHDRLQDDELPLTQEFIAMMLGVHRPTVTVTAGMLERAGLIRRANGRIAILDRHRLEAASCECYGAVKRRFEAVLGTPTG